MLLLLLLLLLMLLLLLLLLLLLFLILSLLVLFFFLLLLLLLWHAPSVQRDHGKDLNAGTVEPGTRTRERCFGERVTMEGTWERSERGNR